MRIAKKRIAVVVCGAAVIALSGGAAMAYWTTGGTGTGTAGAGTTADVTIKQTSTITGLYPGGPAVTLSGNFDNPNPGPVKVAGVLATGLSVTNGGSTPDACVPGDFELAGNTATMIDVPPGGGQGSWTGLTVRLTNNPAKNQDKCKNATLNITYDVG